MWVFLCVYGREKNFLNPSTEVWALPNAYSLWKHVHTKSKKSNKGALYVTNQKHIRDMHELMSKATFKVNQQERVPPCLCCELPGNGSGPQPAGPHVHSPHPCIYTWANNSLLSSEVPHSAPTSIPTLTLSNISYCTFASWEVYFSIIKKYYKSHYRKLGNDLLQFDQEQKPGNSRIC